VIPWALRFALERHYGLLFEELIPRARLAVFLQQFSQMTASPGEWPNRSMRYRCSDLRDDDSCNGLEDIGLRNAMPAADPRQPLQRTGWDFVGRRSVLVGGGTATVRGSSEAPQGREVGGGARRCLGR
jgi:hypothetical protein